MGMIVSFLKESGLIMKCINRICNRCVSFFEVDEEHAIAPYECENEELKQLFSYFQHRSPNVDSLKSPYLTPDNHEDVLRQMLKGNEDFHFCRQNSNTEDELRAVALNGVRVCVRCKRFMCKRTTQPAKRDNTRSETDLECLLRHLRNSIAHGHVYVNQGGNYNSILFEDENNKHNITARIVCCQADLRKWRTVLRKAIKDQN